MSTSSDARPPGQPIAGASVRDCLVCDRNPVAFNSLEEMCGNGKLADAVTFRACDWHAESELDDNITHFTDSLNAMRRTEIGFQCYVLRGGKFIGRYAGPDVEIPSSRRQATGTWLRCFRPTYEIAQVRRAQIAAVKDHQVQQLETVLAHLEMARLAAGKAQAALASVDEGSLPNIAPRGPNGDRLAARSPQHRLAETGAKQMRAKARLILQHTVKPALKEKRPSATAVAEHQEPLWARAMRAAKALEGAEDVQDEFRKALTRRGRDVGSTS